MGEERIPFGNDRKKGKGGFGSSFEFSVVSCQLKRIALADDRKKGNGKNKGKSRFPSGMTTRKATATARARTTTKYRDPSTARHFVTLRSGGQPVFCRLAIRCAGVKILRTGFGVQFSAVSFELRAASFEVRVSRCEFRGASFEL
jgi:hypothetical protein